ncbi:MAG: hypothetical protein AAF358_13665 [Pseudomonadota bacterium]
MAVALASKDPDADLPYTIDASPWLNGGNLTAADFVGFPVGLTLYSKVFESTGLITFWLGGGTVGQNYQWVLRLTTDVQDPVSLQFLKDDRTVTISVAEK